MAITNYIDSNGLRLMVAQLPSGAFDLYFSNGIVSPLLHTRGAPGLPPEE